jgi:transposase
MPPHDIATRAQALALKLVGVSNQDIQRLTGIHPRTVHNIMDRAIERGLDLNHPIILEIHVRDGPRTGRPKKRDKQPRERSTNAVEEGPRTTSPAGMEIQVGTCARLLC